MTYYFAQLEFCRIFTILLVIIVKKYYKDDEHLKKTITQSMNAVANQSLFKKLGFKNLF